SGGALTQWIPTHPIVVMDLDGCAIAPGEGWPSGHPTLASKEIAMGHAIEELARFAADTPWETIPKAVREHAKLVLLDTLGVMIAGSVQPEVAGWRARLTATGGRGATVYAHGWPTTDPRTAALLNGLAGRSIELCEGHRYVSCQGAVQVLPTG